MGIKDQKAWSDYVKNNQDGYGRCVIDAAKLAMEILDKNNQKLDYESANQVIHKVNHDLKLGLSGFQAGCIAQVIVNCHDRGEEFRRAWNKEADVEGVRNPALMTVELETEK